MKLARTHNYTLFFLCALLLSTTTLAVRAQEAPTRIDITWVDTSQLPQIEVYVAAFASDGGRHPGLFANMIELSEDGSERLPSMYDAPRGTALTFLIDADQTAQVHWADMREAIESYASPAWMDEDLDYLTIVVADGQQTETLAETSFHVAVSNAFIDETGAYYEPSYGAATPLNDLIGDTLTAMEGAEPTPGMYRALVVFSAGNTVGSQRSLEGVTTLAQEENIPLYTVQLGEDAAGEQTMQQLASNSGGQSYRLDTPGSLAGLWEVLSSHRQQYAISYPSQIVASGSHTVKVQVADGVSDSYSFDITVLNPQVEITLPQANDVILRSPPQPDAPTADYEPKTQAVKYLWTWPDQHERQVNTVQLRVNGVVQQQLDFTVSGDRSLVWDIATLEAGLYSLRVEVIDELGLMGQSSEIPVAIEIESLVVVVEPTAAAEVTATPSPGLLTSALGFVKQQLGCVAISGLSLGALLAALFFFRNRLSRLTGSPIRFLRSLPIFRPIDGLLRQVERLTGALRIRKPAVGRAARNKEPIARVEVIAGQTAAPSPIEIKSELALGRSKENAQVVFSDRTMSRLHARLVPEHGGKYRVYNQSSQGTWVNEQRVPEYGLLLKDGDEIRMGQVRLRFRRNG